MSADLRPGDVVEARHVRYPLVVIRGPVQKVEDGDFMFGPFLGWIGGTNWDVTVIERAPRPLYVNHDRAEPVPGDVVRDADDVTRIWLTSSDDNGDEAPAVWWIDMGANWCDRSGLPDRLRLLVDGDTGQVVP